LQSIASQPNYYQPVTAAAAAAGIASGALQNRLLDVDVTCGFECLVGKKLFEITLVF